MTKGLMVMMALAVVGAIGSAHAQNFPSRQITLIVPFPRAVRPMSPPASWPIAFVRDQQTPEGLAAFHKAEIEKWWPVIRAAGIKAQ